MIIIITSVIITKQPYLRGIYYNNNNNNNN